jgi:hypothetical protein
MPEKNVRPPTTNELLEEILAELKLIASNPTPPVTPPGSYVNPYIDLVTNPKVKWLVLQPTNRIVHAGETVTIYENLNLAGYLYYTNATSSSSKLQFLYEFNLTGGTIPLLIDYEALNMTGYANGLTIRLMKYDTANSIFMAEYWPMFPGVPINGTVTITAINNDAIDAVYSAFLGILQVMP